MAKKNLLLNAPIRAIVKFHELILTFDTSKTNEEIEKQANLLLEEINELLSRHLKQTLPQLSRDTKRRAKISVLPVTQDELDPE